MQTLCCMGHVGSRNNKANKVGTQPIVQGGNYDSSVSVSSVNQRFASPNNTTKQRLDPNASENKSTGGAKLMLEGYSKD